MKKVTFSFIALLALNHAFGQWAPTTTSTTADIHRDGNVGIGTTSPQSKLDVEGDVLLLAGIHKMYFTGGTSSDPTKAGFRNNSGNLVMNAKDGGTLYLNRDVNADTRIQSTIGANTIDIATFKSSGNVGIGTTSPQSKLDVEGDALLLAGIHKMYFTGGTSSDPTKAGFRNNSGNLIMNAKDGGTLYLNRDVNADTRIQSTIGANTIDIATFKSSGNVGIGTDDPMGYKLAVNGSAIFESAKVKLHSNWPDYVFQATYRLPSLTEVEKFIQQNNHLPDVPSATEVEKNGLDLGASQATLLKKIEELTLYVIEQNKKLEAQQRRIELLEKRK